MSGRMTVSDRKRRVDEIDLRLAEIDTEFNGGKLTDEARTEWEELKVERADHREAIVDAERREEELAEIAADRDGEDLPNGERASEPVKERKRVQVKTSSQRRVKDPFNLDEYSRAARSLDDLQDLYREGARMVLDRVEIPGRNVDEAKSKTNVERLLKTIDGDGNLARRIVVTGSPEYQRAFGKAVLQGNTMGLTSVEQAALARSHGGQTTAGADGGFAVPFTLDPSVILTSDGSINPLRQISRVVQITTTKWQGVTSAGISVSRAAEASEAAVSKATLVQPEVEPTRVHGFVPFSIEIQQDWSALQSELAVMLQDAKDDEEVDSFVHGTGLGLEPGGLVETLPSGSKVDTGGASFAPGDVYGLEVELPVRWRARARFVGPKATYSALRQFASADGHDLWVRIGDGQPPQVLGYPAHELSSMDGPGEDGDSFLVFGDFNQFIIVDRVGMSVELIPHLFGGNQRPTGERGIYAIWRNSSKVLVPGAFRALTQTS